MKKGGNIDLKALSKGLTGFLQRFHTIIFFVVLGAALATALSMVVLTLGDTGSPSDNGSDVVNGTFDEQTMQALREEQDSINQPFKLPSGRTNPFVE